MKDRRRAGGFEIRQFLGAALLFLSLLALTACQPEDDADGSQGNIAITRIEAGIEGMGTATRAFTENVATGYTGAEKTKFVPGDVIHLIAASKDNDAPQRYSHATLNDKGTWDITPALTLKGDDEKIIAFYNNVREAYEDADKALGGAYNKSNDASPGDVLIADGGSGGNGSSPSGIGGGGGSVTISNGVLTLSFAHQHALICISAIDNHLGTGYDVIDIKAHIASSSQDGCDIPLITDGSGGWQCIANGYYETCSDYYLKSFTLTLGTGTTAAGSLTVDVSSSFLSNGRELCIGKRYTYRLTLLPGSATATEDDTQGPAWNDARRDPTVPAGYIPIYTVEDLQKIGVPVDCDYTSDPVTYAPATVNGYTYTTTDNDSGDDLTFSLDGNYILMADIDLTATPADGTPAAGASTSPASSFVRSTRGGKFSAASTRAGDTPDSKWAPIEGTNWKPIGGVDINNASNPAEAIANSAPFTGCFNGNGHTIRGMKIGIQLEEINGNSGYAYLGLFGRLSNAAIYNLHFEDATVEAKKPNSGGCAGVNAGALAGLAINSTLTLCSATNCQVTGTSYVGGLIGCNHNGKSIQAAGDRPSYLTHCYAADCTVESNSNNSVTYAGGLVGTNMGILVACYTTSCSATATTSTHAYAGGLVGYTERATIYGCYAANAAATATGSNNTNYNVNAGVLIGRLYDNNINNKAISCYATAGSGSSDANSGGIPNNEGTKTVTTASAPHLIGRIDSGSSVTIAACISPLQNDGGASPSTSGTDGTVPDAGSDVTGYPGGGYYWGAEIGYSPLVSDPGSTDNIVDDCPNVRTVVSTNGALSVNTGTWTAAGIWGNIPTEPDGSQVPPHIRWSYDGENN